MDESWRMRMGVTGLCNRRRSSMEETSSSRRSSLLVAENYPLDPEYFKDVFGGPPKSVLSRTSSSEFTESDYVFREIFRQQETESPDNKVGRTSPEFRIPVRNGVEETEFYSDVFGSRSGDWRSRSRSKSKTKSVSNSSSVLSSEELSSLRRGIGDDVTLSSFASKLRPINVPMRWDLLNMVPGRNHTKQDISSLSFMDNDYLRNSNLGYSQPLPSPDTGNKEPSAWMSMDDVQVGLNSPSLSTVSTLCEDPEAKPTFQNNEEDEIASSFVIEIASQPTEAVDNNEAIKWAEVKFQAWRSETQVNLANNQSAEIQGNGREETVVGRKQAAIRDQCKPDLLLFVNGHVKIRIPFGFLWFLISPFPSA
ncbi:hypothetical protein Ancab_021420 [Ancistrocladus abbreviatus]